MNEQMAASLVIRQASGEKSAVWFGYPVRQCPTGATRHPSIRAKGIRAPQREPLPQGVLIAEGIERGLFVVPQKGD